MPSSQFGKSRTTDRGGAHGETSRQPSAPLSRGFRAAHPCRAVALPRARDHGPASTMPPCTLLCRLRSGVIELVEYSPPWPKVGPPSYFSSIEKKYGRSISHWQGVISGCGLDRHMAIVDNFENLGMTASGKVQKTKLREDAVQRFAHPLTAPPLRLPTPPRPTPSPAPLPAPPLAPPPAARARAPAARARPTLS